MTREKVLQEPPYIVGLPLGEVRYDHAGQPQAYFGGRSVERLIPYGTVALRAGAIAVEMFTLADREDVDYALITIRPPANGRSATERAIARRTGGINPAILMERTPVQRFDSIRRFADIPISGRARWLRITPDGTVQSGLFYDEEVNGLSAVQFIGQAETFAWVAEGSRPFVFGELCSPRFIDAGPDYPVGEEGITEMDGRLAELPPAFVDPLRLYMSGEHLRLKVPG